MKTKRFKNLENAINSILKSNEEFAMIKHEFPAGKKVDNHYHPKATEWVIFDSGEVDLIYENKTHNIKPDGNVIVAIIPPRVEHYLITKSDIKYYVIRDRKAQTVYVD